MDSPRIIEPVPVLLDRERHLLFDRRAVRQSEIALSQHWGKERTFFSAMVHLVQTLADGDVAALSITDISVLLWQGLLAEDPTVTYAEVEAALPYMTPGDLVPIAIALMQAWQAASPPAPSDPTPHGGGTDPDPLAASTGTPVGPMTAPSLA
jgi:hypothetical protein